MLSEQLLELRPLAERQAVQWPLVELATDVALLRMRVHGGLGYTRAKPFEHIYRHHRRYRITEGSEEMQIRNVAGHLFGFIRG
jgi:acyl-CoA dehydrogenase